MASDDLNNIAYNEKFFVDSTCDDDETKLSQRKVFINFITNSISHYTNHDVNKFTLKLSNPQTCSDTIERCIIFATQRGVKELTLDFSNPKLNENNFDNHDVLFHLPEHVYQLGSSLESMKLYSCGFSIPEYFFYFSALKDVSLGYIEVRIDTLKTLLSSCRTIENLSLEKCWNLKHFDLGDEPIRLKKLVLDKCNIDSEYLKLNAPNLKYFKYCGVVFTSDINVRPHVIEEADIDFALESEFYERGNELCKILQDLLPAKILRVCSYLLQVVPSEDELVHLQSELNVKHLILKTAMHPNEFCGFEFLLNSCPFLEKLTLDIAPTLIFQDYTPPFDDMELNKFWQSRRVIPQCLRRNLKVVEIVGSRATQDELIAYCFFMQAGRVLEHININLYNQDAFLEMRRGRAQLLLNSPKASKNLQISIK